jgi:hypothetical protein
MGAHEIMADTSSPDGPRPVEACSTRARRSSSPMTVPGSGRWTSNPGSAGSSTARLRFKFTFTKVAYDLIRPPKLLGASA